MTSLRSLIAWLSLVSVVLIVVIATWSVFSGHAPSAILMTALRGAAGNGVRLALSLQEAGPLVLTGLATAIAFRCGVLNIGAEGQYLVGAVIAVGLATRWIIPGSAASSIVFALAGAAVAGAAWALIAGALERYRGAPLVLTTILLNFIAVAVVGMLIDGPLHDQGTSAPQTAVITDRLRLGSFVVGSRLHIGVVIAGALAIAAWVVQRWAVIGFELTAIGLNPEASLLAGIPVQRRRMQALVVSGALAGLAGGFQQLGVAFFMSPASASYGYAGIAVAMLARLNALAVIPAAVFFAMLDTASRALERAQGIPRDIGDAAQGLIVLVAVIVATIAATRRLRGRPVPSADTATS